MTEAQMTAREAEALAKRLAEEALQELVDKTRELRDAADEVSTLAALQAGVRQEAEKLARTTGASLETFTAVLAQRQNGQTRTEGGAMTTQADTPPGAPT